MLIIKRRSWPFQTTPNLLNSVSVKYWINPDTKSKVLLSPESGRGKCSKIFYDAADAPDLLGKIMSMQQSISKWHSLCPSLVPASLCLQSTDIHWLMISTWRCACNVHKPSSRQPQRKQASPANKLDKNGKKGEEKKKEKHRQSSLRKSAATVQVSPPWASLLREMVSSRWLWRSEEPISGAETVMNVYWS